MSTREVGIGRCLRRALAALVGIGTTLGLAPTARAADLIVFAAASLTNALDEVVAHYEDRTGRDVTVSYASSSALAKQVEQGAPADVYLSANVAWMDYLAERDLIRPGSRIDLLGNSLVLVAPAGGGAAPVTVDRTLPLARMLGDGRLAMGDPDHVPAGIYGRQALVSLGLWDAVAPRVARADNVRVALALVARGEVPFGVVYGSDAAADPNVTVIGIFPPDSHDPIVYPAALVRPGRSAAADFLDHLTTTVARQIFARHGFTTPTPVN